MKRSKLELEFERQLRRSFLKGPKSQWKSELRFHPVRQWRLDFAWPSLKIGVEIQGGTWKGGRHTRGMGYEKDCEKLNTLVLMGWRVLLLTSRTTRDGTGLELLEELLA